MKRFLNIRSSLVLVAFLTVAMVLPAWSDTLVLRNGMVISGTLTGANADSVTFRERGGDTRRYAVRDVDAVQFGDGPYRANRGDDDRRDDRGPRGGRTLVCLQPDTGSTDRNFHYGWARNNPNDIERNLMMKMETLFGCPALRFDDLTDTFANISVILPRYVNNARCFGGDNGPLNPDPAYHRSWAASQGRADAVLRNLESKTRAALGCVDRSRRADLFADISVTLAQGAYR